jgi:hypothetical protein
VPLLFLSLRKETNMWKDKLNQQFNENPLQVLAVAAFVATAAAKLIAALSGVQSKRAYARMYRSKR